MFKELMYKWFDLEPLPCQSCETLKMQLAIANHEKQELMNTILSSLKKPEETTAPAVDYEKIKPRMATWNVRRQMLEAEDRNAARLMAEQQKKKAINEDIEKLEKELGVEEVKSDA